MMTESKVVINSRVIVGNLLFKINNYYKSAEIYIIT